MTKMGGLDIQIGGREECCYLINKYSIMRVELKT